MKALALALCIWVSWGVASAQLTIDASGPTRERHRQPSSGSGGGTGYKLPIEVAVKAIAGAPDENGRTLVEFALTNTGRKQLAVPISPHPGDLEPEESKASYTAKMLNIYLTLDTVERASRQQVTLPGGAYLYGSSDSPGTIVSLATGESINVLAPVALPSTDSDNGRVIVGRVSLNDETIKTVRGQTSSEVKEIGCSESRDLSASLSVGTGGEVIFGKT
jgi:hypothetical protein